jgi:hypothetical protein
MKISRFSLFWIATASTHTRFKTACSATGRKMVGEIHDFIEQRIAELETEAGITRK